MTLAIQSLLNDFANLQMKYSPYARAKDSAYRQKLYNDELSKAYSRLNEQWYKNTGSRSSRRTINSPMTSFYGQAYGSAVNSAIAQNNIDSNTGRQLRELYKIGASLSKYI